MNRTILRNSRSAQHGFTLVELMVGVLVGLIATVVMFQMFAVSEGQKRTTTGAGDAQQNGVFSLFQLERDGRMAGYGLNYTPLLGCETNGFHTAGGGAFQFRLQPLLITNGAGGAPDQITFLYGSSDMFAAPEKLKNNPASQFGPGETGMLLVGNRFGYEKGDLIVLGQVGRPCTLSQVRDLPGTAGNLDRIYRDSGTYVDSGGISRTTAYNPNGGMAPNTTYTAWVDAASTGSRLFNLGSQPTLVTYRVANNRLEAVDGLVPGATPDVLAEGIVQLQAQYGYDGNGDGNLPPGTTSVATATSGPTDQWADAMPAGATATDWSRVIAVRLAIVARSLTPEKKDGGGNCSTTSANPRWNAAAADIDITTTNAEWGCYRYRTFEVIVPLRNLIWWPQ